MFPIKNYKYEIPQGNHLGAFGTIRKHDIHTGIDLYCEKDTPNKAQKSSSSIQLSVNKISLNDVAN